MATVSYGDGTPPTSGTINPDGGDTFVVDGGPHVYQSPGPFRITVSLTDKNDNTSMTTDPVTVDPAITLGPLDPTQWNVNEPNYQGSIVVSGGSDSYSNLNVTGLPSGLNAFLWATQSKLKARRLPTAPSPWPSPSKTATAAPGPAMTA